MTFSKILASLNKCLGKKNTAPSSSSENYNSISSEEEEEETTPSPPISSDEDNKEEGDRSQPMMFKMDIGEKPNNEGEGDNLDENLENMWKQQT